MRDRGLLEAFLMLLCALAAVVALVAGCSNDLPAASRLERTRVLGARVRVAADPGRADAEPGESAAIEWLVAGPRTPPSLAWVFAQCTGVGGACADAPAPVASGMGFPVLAPFTAPAVPSATGGPLMIGAVCDGGAAAIDPAACTGAVASANVARFAIPIAPAGETPNRHPALANDLVELDDAAWTTEPIGDAGAPCDATAGLPVVVAGSAERHVRLVTDGDDRESYLPPGAPAGSAPVLETLQLSNFATAGKLAGSYQAIAATDTRPDADFVAKWTPPAPADVPAGGLTVNFHLVVRDGRGGLDWLHRAVCVVSP
jgi:hypothetical protein